MNINKKLKPNLVDPKYRAKIGKTLNPPEDDYWKPTKNVAQTIYADYVRPNIWLFVLILAFLIFLLYRYRIIQNQRVEENLRSKKTQENYSPQNPTIDYSDIALHIYNQQKEKSTEPKVNTKRNTDRVNWAQPRDTFAYPIFPNTPGGTLIPNINEK